MFKPPLKQYHRLAPDRIQEVRLAAGRVLASAEFHGDGVAIVDEALLVRLIDLILPATNKRRPRARTRAQKSWAGMISRCRNPKSKDYKDYGGRGITVCERWSHSSKNFVADMGQPPDGMVLDRIDVNGNYEPVNCRWVTLAESANNKRSNRRLTFNGETRTITQWAKHLGLNPSAVGQRIRQGWDVEKALTTPTRITKQTRN